ncbi:MAG TPA: UDP-N-acetylglucosamine 2-epimerase (non-hydrolyzing), partial [Acidimicrobiales bacterium]|nr:UDP-N-acetylglucosamine 2-epimerase (non-hydrolyzing) [Acidimicrobiales bacterium]
RAGDEEGGDHERHRLRTQATVGVTAAMRELGQGHRLGGDSGVVVSIGTDALFIRVLELLGKPVASLRVRVVCVAGARPNFMKIKPVMAALEARGADVVLVHTGQHYDAAMSEVFFTELGIRTPDHWLGVGSGSHAEQTARVMTALEPLVEKLAPEVVVVVGDVNSTLACALVGAKAGCLVAHVEAGLRSRDWAMPEEVNRVVADRVSDFLLAPSPDAVDNLVAEGYRDDQIHLVGNVMVDSLLSNLERARARPVLGEMGLVEGDYGVVTLHRPANVEDPSMLGGLLSALNTVAEHCPLVFPVHPRTKVHLAGQVLSPSLRLVEPVGYLDFVALEAGARLVLTDSGGVQEETTVLGVPCLTLRATTERPITVTHGTNTVVGLDPERIVAEAARVLRDGVEARCPPLWDGRAGERIASVLLADPPAGGRRRPTALAG